MHFFLMRDSHNARLPGRVSVHLLSPELGGTVTILIWEVNRRRGRLGDVLLHEVSGVMTGALAPLYACFNLDNIGANSCRLFGGLRSLSVMGATRPQWTS